MTTKGNFILAAYQRLRISGITSAPTTGDTALALARLENMAAQWQSQIATGYIFEDIPSVATEHSVARKFWNAFETSLAVLLAPDFGKAIPAELRSEQVAALSNMFSRQAIISQVPYPSRMPVGSGNRYYNQRYFPYTDPNPSVSAESPETSLPSGIYITFDNKKVTFTNGKITLVEDI